MVKVISGLTALKYKPTFPGSANVLSLQKGMTTHSNISHRQLRGQRSLAGYSPWVHKESDKNNCSIF